MVARAPDGSHLIGSAITMPASARKLRDELGLSSDEVRQITFDNPRRAIGLEI
jgi:N-acetylglucosamine-6-phosphate deacetylase